MTNIFFSFVSIIVVAFIVGIITVSYGINPESADGWRIFTAGVFAAAFINGFLLAREVYTSPAG